MDDSSEDPRRATQFQHGNPGRPKGSRNKLGEAFVSALQSDFEEHGEDVIRRVREERPHEYLKVVASLLPRELKLPNELEGMTDEQLSVRIQHIAAALGLAIHDPDETEGEEEADTKELH